LGIGLLQTKSQAPSINDQTNSKYKARMFETPYPVWSIGI
jgi:hypothetical protein